MITKDYPPRAIVFSINHTYMNPTEEAQYEMLSRVFELVFYGPGHVALWDLKDDAKEIFDQKGSFEAAFFHEYYWDYVTMGPLGRYKNLAELIDYLKRRRHLPFDWADFVKWGLKPSTNFDCLPGSKFLILKRDPHKFTEEDVRALEAFPGFFITTYPLQVLRPSKLMTGPNPSRRHDIYLDFCARNTKRIIPFTHLIGDDEFRFVPIATRKRTVCVPGKQYERRRRAVQSLQTAGRMAPVAYPLQQMVESVFNRVGPYRPLRRYKWGIQFLRWGYTRLISTSLVAYTDGALVQYAVRKFFEIPALGTLLVAEPFYGRHHLGFEEGVHYIPCTPSELPEIVNKADRDRDWAQRIILQGQHMVRARFSTTAYAQRFRELWPSLLDGTYAGAEWRQGELFLSSQQPTEF